MKICSVIQRYPPAVGGSEIWTQEICRYLSKKNEVTVLTMDINHEEEFWRDPLPDDCILKLGACEYDGKVKVRRFHRSLPVYWVYHGILSMLLDKCFNIYFYGPHSIEMYAHMYKYFKKHDIVNTYTIPYPHNFFALFFAKLARKKIIITPFFHPEHEYYERRTFYWLIKKADKTLVLTDFEKQHLVKKGVDPKKTVVVGAGIHPKDYQLENLDEQKKRIRMKYRLGENDKIIIFISRKIPYKGVDTLIEAVQKVREQHKDVKLLLLGPTSTWFEEYYNSLSDAAKESLMDLGYVSAEEKITLLHISSLLVHPSAHESFGMIFLEAWICNTPVIGSNSGAIPSVIEKGGLTFEYGNTKELAEKVNQILENPELAKELSQNGYKQVMEKYTWDKVGAKIAYVYEELTQQSPPLNQLNNEL